jgi:hypothetical protein
VSYDIDMLRLSGTGDLLVQARALTEELFLKEERGERPTPSAEDDLRRTALAADLVALHPSLRMEPSPQGFSHGCAIDTDDPDCEIPAIEIGIDTALVSFSYSADADRIFAALQPIIAVFARHGYVAYDPQSDSLLPAHATPSAASFLRTRSQVFQQLEAQADFLIGGATNNPLRGIVIALAGLGAVVLMGLSAGWWGQ